MHADSASRQTFGKNSSPGFAGRMTPVRARARSRPGTLLAKLDDKAPPAELEQERIWTLLSVAYGEKISQGVFGSLRRVAKHWQGGDKGLAAIHLAQMSLPDIDEDAAYRLSLAAELIDEGVAPREIARELGFGLPAGLVKYDPNEARVPAGSGYGSGDWTNGNAAGSSLTGGRSAGVSLRSKGANSGKVINIVPELPKDAIVVTRPDGTTIDDPKSPTKKLMAPPRANFPGGLRGWRTDCKLAVNATN